MRQGLHTDPEQRVDDKGVINLGCRHAGSSVKLLNGGMATTMTYGMEDLLDYCIQQYVLLAAPRLV